MADALDAWRKWSASRSAWQFDAAAEWWLPQVWWNLRHSALDDGDRNWLREAYRRSWLRFQHCAVRVAPLLEALSAEGIQTIVLKGAALAVTVYARPALRPFGDIDLLVPSADGPRARAVVERLGWVPVRRVPPGARGAGTSLNYTDAQGVDVDLHWAALAECTAPGADDGFWARAREARLGDAPVRVLSPEDQLLHVLVHGQRQQVIPTGHWMADAISLLRSSGDRFDWTACVAEARSRSLSLQLRKAVDEVAAAGGHAWTGPSGPALAGTRARWWEAPELRAKSHASHPGLIVEAACAWWRERSTARSAPGVAARLRAAFGTDLTVGLATQKFRRYRRRRPCAMRFVLLGRTIHVSVDRQLDPEAILAAVRSRLPPIVEVAHGHPSDRAYEVLPMAVSSEHPLRLRVLVNRQNVAGAIGADDAADALVADLQTFVAAVAEDRILIHAGVVAHRGEAIVLPGASGAGKTTFVEALLRAGAGYLSDEFAVFDPDGRVHPYARPLHRRRPGGDDRSAAIALGARVVGSPLRVGAVLFTAFRADAHFAPRPISPATAMVDLLNHAPGARLRPDDALTCIRAAIAGASLWSGERGEAADAAVDVMAGRLASNRQRPPESEGIAGDPDPTIDLK